MFQVFWLQAAFNHHTALSPYRTLPVHWTSLIVSMRMKADYNMSTTYITNMDSSPKVHRIGGSMSLFPVFRFHAPLTTTTSQVLMKQRLHTIPSHRLSLIVLMRINTTIGTTCPQQSAVRLQTMDPPLQVHAQAIDVSESIFPAFSHILLSTTKLPWVLKLCTIQNQHTTHPE